MIAALLLAAATGAAPQPVFACAIGAREVRVTRVGEIYTYTYGPPGRPELRLAASAAAGNLHFLAQRYAGMEYQLRFSRGTISYVVYQVEGNPRVGARAVSGVVAFRGTERIADLSCRRYAEFADIDALLALPEDTDTYSAM